MGFLVSDVKYTQKNIQGLLVDVMFEASFFGFEQENLELEKTKLDESVKEAKLGNVNPIEDLYDYFGIEKEAQDKTAKNN